MSLTEISAHLLLCLDMNTNDVISYDLSLNPNLEQISRMLDRAFEKFPSVNGLIFHSDQGWQYRHAYFRNALQKHGIIQAMSRKGNCYDNCIMETFFGRLKNEMYYGCEKDYSSFDSFAATMQEYIDYYNNERIQAKTKWMPPVKFREHLFVHKFNFQCVQDSGHISHFETLLISIINSSRQAKRFAGSICFNK